MLIIVVAVLSVGAVMGAEADLMRISRIIIGGLFSRRRYEMLWILLLLRAARRSIFLLSSGVMFLLVQY